VIRVAHDHGLLQEPEASGKLQHVREPDGILDDVVAVRVLEQEVRAGDVGRPGRTCEPLLLKLATGPTTTARACAPVPARLIQR